MRTEKGVIYDENKFMEWVFDKHFYLVLQFMAEVEE